jgi:hypothetical protein
MKRARPSFTEAVFDFLTSRPGQWVKADVLALVGGKYAWRTRISEARVQLETAGLGTIRNRQSRMQNDEHETICTVSEYRFEPHIAQAPDQAGRLF